MGGLVFFLVIFVIWYIWLKLSPDQAGMMKVKFDYDGGKKTAFYSKFKVTIAVLFWLLVLVVGITMSDPKTTAMVLGVVTFADLMFIVYYLSGRSKIKKLKENAIKIPGKIVGLRKKTHTRITDDGIRRYTSLFLIVEYVNPRTLQKEEYVTPSVNGSPFYYLKSLDVTVYYQDAEHIWVEDFKRIKKLRDNVAKQVTGRVNGKDPGLLRYEEI